LPTTHAFATNPRFWLPDVCEGSPAQMPFCEGSTP
jgi:hypothetical protein